MTLKEIINAVAAYFEVAPTDFTINDVDLGLVALNQVRQNAEQQNDFNFTRKLLSVSVDGVTGGSLDTAVDYVTGESLDIKTIVDVGVFDTDGNLRPVEWTTVGDSLNRERLDNPMYVPRVPTDAQAECGPIGQQRFLFSGNNVFYFPKTANTTFTLGIEAYTFSADWLDEDLDDDCTDEGDPWLKRGSMYLQWATIIHLNQLKKTFVFRQEGNLPPPQALADLALSSLITSDNFKLEQFRRHSR